MIKLIFKATQQLNMNYTLKISLKSPKKKKHNSIHWVIVEQMTREKREKLPFRSDYSVNAISLTLQKKKIRETHTI